MEDVYTVISGTNRVGSNSLKIANHYKEKLEALGKKVKVLSLADLEPDHLVSCMYGKSTEKFAQLVKDNVENSSKFIFVLGEYNGGFPGAVKLFIDSVNPKFFYDKKAALCGLSSGHLGCVRGQDQFTDILNYLRIDVLALKPKLSGIEGLLSEDGKLTDERCIEAIDNQLNKFIIF